MKRLLTFSCKYTSCSSKSTYHNYERLKRKRLKISHRSNELELEILHSTIFWKDTFSWITKTFKKKLSNTLISFPKWSSLPTSKISFSTFPSQSSKSCSNAASFRWDCFFFVWEWGLTKWITNRVVRSQLSWKRHWIRWTSSCKNSPLKRPAR